MPISTSSSPKYWETTFLPTLADSNNQFYIDVLSDRLVDLVNSVNRFSSHTIQEGDKITTISYNYYGTTSLYYLILYFNGLLFWDQLVPGDIIQIPALDEINSFFGRNRQQIGQQVVI